MAQEEKKPKESSPKKKAEDKVDAKEGETLFKVGVNHFRSLQYARDFAAKRGLEVETVKV